MSIDYALDAQDTCQPPADPADFLAAGRPPICVTFGSMIHRYSERIYRIVLDAISRTGNCGLLLAGWGSLQESSQSENIFVAESIPHDWLFPRCQAVIHHGGAGTTGAGLRAGIPNLVVSFAADQPFWGTRVHTIGAGPEPIPVKKLTAGKLIAAINVAGGDALRNRAQAIGSKIRAEDGVGQTVKFIEEYAANRRESSKSTIF